jgi:hypothetical protein
MQVQVEAKPHWVVYDREKDFIGYFLNNLDPKIQGPYLKGATVNLLESWESNEYFANVKRDRLHELDELCRRFAADEEYDPYEAILIFFYLLFTSRKFHEWVRQRTPSEHIECFLSFLWRRLMIYTSGYTNKGQEAKTPNDKAYMDLRMFCEHMVTCYNCA